MLSEDITWATLARDMEDVYLDSLYGIDNLVEFWFDDTIDHSLISYDEWFGRPGHY